MRFFLVFIAYILFAKSAIAQGENSMNAIKGYFKKKPKFTAYLDGRNSFSDAARNNIFGAFIGASYAGRIDIGLAYYQTAFSPKVPNYINEGTPVQDTNINITSYQYFALKTSYMFHKSKKWELSIPFSIGIGSAAYNSYDTFRIVNRQYEVYTAPNRSFRSNIFPIETGFDATYLITPWFVVSAGTGYRANLGNSGFNRNLNGVYYRAGFGIRFGYIYGKVKKYLKIKKCCCLF
ncbi:MAG: hypothetical protein HYZ42_05825 [Bacteroidetes bacterium]|nr:hypothetical protein [Bacteroidota bacterium]